MARPKNCWTCSRPKTECNCWRNTVITEDILSKLESWFANALTDEECCLYSWISPATLYRYIEKNPKFWERKELLKRKPNIKAKMNKIKAINEWNVVESWWWLERKSRDEFSTKQITEAKIDVEINPLEDRLKELWLS